MRFAFKTSPQNTTWADMLAVWKAADDIDVYESGWTFDHFYPIFSDSTGPCLEGWTTLTALAQATTRLRLGTLVTGIHYRHPAVLANMVAALDIISNGRLELGIGAGWNEEESGAYGIELGSIRERMDRFEEACQVLTSLLSQETTDFDGKYYQLKAARNEPKGPQRPTRRSASAAAAKNAPCVSPPATPSTGTLPAAQPRNSPASATSWPRTAPTSAATRRRSCCRRTCSWAGPQLRTAARECCHVGGRGSGSGHRVHRAASRSGGT
ncbi:luciferase-like monooxygenase family protein [Mycobacterium xenopi 4042]|uniref:Luciferase-like monooxygenase family protein n=1 Tax=Mycobacterium xenopi 4042 TaxID=1299334 RepID=X8CLQ7_MYCXE|nr:luciferase-like monooxygenase family protein [Mycobacterium xenopi 4042]